MIVRLFNGTVQLQSLYSIEGDVMIILHGKLVRIWKVAFTACLKVLHWQPVEDRATTKNFSPDSW
jgi:hypothetical protein